MVLITGGSNGIGFAAARRFAELGARVWIAARDEERLASAAAELGAAVTPFAADVTDPASLEALVSAIRERDGGIGVLVNSAGQFVLESSGSSAALEERMMRVNYLGTVGTIAACLPLLRAGSRRSIVNLSSFAGRLAPPYFGAYAASKHAVMSYSHALRQELRPEGFHIGLVLPGPVLTDMTRDVLNTAMYPVPFGVPVIGPEKVADSIARCVLRRSHEMTVPGRFLPLLRLASAFPRLIDLVYRRYTKS